MSVMVHMSSLQITSVCLPGVDYDTLRTAFRKLQISNRMGTHIKEGIDSDHDLVAATGLVNQLACADVILLNKCDITSAEDLSRTKTFLERTAPGAKIHESQFGKVPFALG